MRIGIDYTPGLYQRAGIGRYTRGVVDALARVDSRNEYVLFCATGAKAPDSLVRGLQRTLSDHPNFRLRRVPVSPRLLTALWHRLRLPLPVDALTGPVDVFHWPDFLPAPQAMGKRVVTIHDLSFLTVPECADAGLRKFLCAAVPRAVRRVDAVVAVSHSTGRDVSSLLGIADARIEVVHNGIEEAFFSAQPESCRPYNPPAERYILSVGTIEPRKNLCRLVQAYSKARGAGIDHKLVLAGGLGWMYEGVLDMIDRLELTQDVLRLGHVSDDDLPNLYRHADLMVYPSLYEGFGFPVAEAMACGTPVLCSNTSALPEVAGDAARLVDPLDVDGLAGAITELVSSPEKRSEMSELGLARAGMFTWQSAAKKLLDLYERLASTN